MAKGFKNDNEEFEFEDYPNIVLTLEDDTEINCLVISEFDVGDKSYIALLPIDEANNPGKVLLYRTNYKEDDTFELSLIETNEEFDIVSDVYSKEIAIQDSESIHKHDF